MAMQLSITGQSTSLKNAQWTKFTRAISAIAIIHASIIQGSVLEPASFIVTASDLHPIHKRNHIVKLADDTYFIVLGINTDTCKEEIQHLQTWAANNNLKFKSRQDEGDRYHAASGRQMQIASSRSYREWQTDSCWPYKHVTVIKFQSDVTHTQHGNHVTAWHISCYSHFLDTVQSVSVVGNVLGSRPCVLTHCCVVANGSGTAQTTCQPSLMYSTPQTTTSSTESKLTLTTFFSLTFLTRWTYLTSFASVHTTRLKIPKWCSGVTIICAGPHLTAPDPHQTAPGQKWLIISLWWQIKRRKMSY